MELVGVPQMQAGAVRAKAAGDAPLLSVVMPLYNKAPYVAAAIGSALLDPAAPVEIIVVDDGSTDGSAAIVEAIGDPRIRLIQQPNGGVSKARNTGIDAARGDWVAFLDADDYWLPDFIPTIRRMIGEFPDCGMLCTFYAGEDDAGQRRPPIGGWDFEGEAPRRIDDFFVAMSQGHLCFTGSIVFRRDLIESAGLRFPIGEQLGEDLDFFLRAAELTSVAFCPVPLSIYRDSNQVSRLSQSDVGGMVLPFVDRAEERLARGLTPVHQRRGLKRYLAAHYEHLIFYAIGKGQRLSAWPLMLRPSLRDRPLRYLLLVAALLLPGKLVLGYRRRRRGEI